MRLTPPGWTFLASALLVLGGLAVCLVWGTGPIGILGWVIGLVLAGVGLWGLYDLAGGRIRLVFDKPGGVMTAENWRRRHEVPLPAIRRVILTEVDLKREKRPFIYELLLELNSGEVHPLTRETGAPNDDEREPYEALAQRIHTFLGLPEPVEQRRTAGWPSTDPLPAAREFGGGERAAGAARGARRGAPGEDCPRLRGRV